MTNKYLKGMCYSAFPLEYNPSTANNTCIFYGSDIATANLKALWGKGFSPIDGKDKDKIFFGRDDIKTLNKMGVNLIRLYDWDPRNDHLPFLDYCNFYGIKVLVPVSNYNLGCYGEPINMDKSIKSLIDSFSNKDKTDYHPAIYGITIGNETDLSSNMPRNYHISYTHKWLEIEDSYYSKYRCIPIGHPVSFNKPSDNLPCFDFLDNLICGLKSLPQYRFFLCPQTFNDATYLYDNAERLHRGWVDLAYERYGLPILFTEIGCSSLDRDDYNDVIAKQLERSWEYQKNNPEKLLGTCFFQFCNKSWLTGTTEGSFGVFRNGSATEYKITYGIKDFKYTNGYSCNNEMLYVRMLEANPIYNTVKLIYTADK